MSDENAEKPEAAADEAAATQTKPAEGSNDSRKTRVGIVTSDKMAKTVIVDVVRRVPHPRFKKIIKRTTRLYAHDEDESAKTGDKVQVVETRPMSKKKRWRVVEVLSH